MKFAGAFEGRGTRSPVFVMFSQSSTRRFFRLSGIAKRMDGLWEKASSCLLDTWLVLLCPSGGPKFFQVQVVMASVVLSLMFAHLSSFQGDSERSMRDGRSTSSSGVIIHSDGRLLCFFCW